MATILTLLSFSLGGRAEILAPYTPDEQTLHLWHMDEPAVPLTDAVPNGLALRSLESGATLGNESFVDGKKFGTALGTYVGNPALSPGGAGQSAGLFAQPLQNGREDNVAVRYAGATGAFTYEALVRVDFDLKANFGADGWGNGRHLFMQIICGDADEAADRVFQFCVAPLGTLNDNPQPLLEFINLNQVNEVQSLTAAIPTNGPNAIRTGNWYHLAVAYTGQPDQPENLRFYWTRVQPNCTAANLIGTSQMIHGLPTGCSPDFAIGQTGRQSPPMPTPYYNFVGLIDEVRISGVARSPQEMLFGETDLVHKPAAETTELRASELPGRNPADPAAAATTASTVALAVSPAAATTEAAVDSIRRRAESVTAVGGAIVRGPLSKPRIAILFSCRVADAHSAATLQTLRAQNTKASFFVSRSFLNATENLQLVQSMLADGHYVGPQSDAWFIFSPTNRRHDSEVEVPGEIESHLSQLAVLGVDRKELRYFLPTSDQLTAGIAEQARGLNLTMVAGTSGTLSFATTTAEGSAEFVASQAIVESIVQGQNWSKGLNGFLLLFPFETGPHRTDHFYPYYGKLIEKLRQDGYEFVRVDELLDVASPRKRQPSLATIKVPEPH